MEDGELMLRRCLDGDPPFRSELQRLGIERGVAAHVEGDEGDIGVGRHLERYICVQRRLVLVQTLWPNNGQKALTF